MRTIFSGLFAYIAGFACYTLMLKIVWAQSLGGDGVAVMLWGAIAFFFIAVPIYLLVIRVARKCSNKYHYIYYPLSCMFVFVVPTAFIAMALGGTFDIFGPEEMLFYSFFLATGLVFGLMQSFNRRAAALGQN
ncbi:hypothetical protein P9B03_06685 [Metasolibacillus meyeri]|uniref:Uncharacterized protein n=1 Tax=Metasolibacillus meyeri TaxID=1071052 RepID=A0AAW9NUI8_9BACL|nr:hypothetical protein [Metasolibacillus meyeri]MEC1178165.1 hypothetical protein [Metasolibacillus meyeri]